MQKVILSVMQNKKTGLFQKDLPNVAVGGPIDYIGGMARPAVQGAGWVAGERGRQIGGMASSVSDAVGRAFGDAWGAARGDA
jgi:hypothetical protein